jgi:hypothetical protein
VSRLREIWNVGPDHAEKIAADARGDLRSLFSEDDYPLAMILADKSGSARFGLLIDESGKVKDCTVMEPSGIAVLDGRSCGIIVEKAKLTPAVGPDGKPVRSFWVQQVTWKLAF